MKSFLILLPTLATFASAHATWQQLWVNGVATGSLTQGAVRHDWSPPDGQSNFPQYDVSSPNIVCNKYGTKAAGKTVTVPAGASIRSEWHHETTLRAGDADEPIAASHHGPVMAYLGKVDNAATASPQGVKWFKIFEDGLDSSGKWGVDRMVEKKGFIDFTIPSCIAPGDYLLRTEIIGLHEAPRQGGAQFYMECAQITVTGGGSASPATVDFPGAYTQNQPGVVFNIYGGNIGAYPIPGPRPFTCGASTAPTSAASTTFRTSAAAVLSTTRAPSATPSLQPSSDAGTGTGTSKPYTKAEIAEFMASLQRIIDDWNARGRP